LKSPSKTKNSKTKTKNKGVCHIVSFAIFTLKKYHHLKAKEEEEEEEEVWKLKNISPCKNYIIFKKNLLKRNQNPSR
jgi:hypothetical protein